MNAPPSPPLPRERVRLFDQQAEQYDRYRPGYPEQLIEAILAPDDPASLRILDVACGPGTIARQLAARGARLLGVELNPQMAALAVAHGISCETCAFESWDPAGRRFERVVCAQAWHWLNPQQALDTIAALLIPGGRLCLAWNIGWHPAALSDALHACYRKQLGAEHALTVGYATQRPNTPRSEFSGPLRAVLADDDRFTRARVECFRWQRATSAADWVGELRSHSDHAALSSPLRERLLADVAATIGRVGGSFELNYESILIDAVRR